MRQVACVDTAFHRTNPDLEQRFALVATLRPASIAHMLAPLPRWSTTVLPAARNE